MKTVNIKGKEYVEVNERIKHFRTNKSYEGWSLVSDIVSLENGVCVIKASIYDEKSSKRATGIAYEKEGSTFINKTSYIENCETSAWGRALGNMGIGIDTSIASSNEVENAIANQTKKTTPKQKAPFATSEQIKTIQVMAIKQNLKGALDYFKVKSTEELTVEQANKVIKNWSKEK